MVVPWYHIIIPKAHANEKLAESEGDRNAGDSKNHETSRTIVADCEIPQLLAAGNSNAPHQTGHCHLTKHILYRRFNLSAN